MALLLKPLPHLARHVPVRSSDAIDRKSLGVLMLGEYAMSHSAMQRVRARAMIFLHGSMTFLTGWNAAPTAIL
ncbi:MAG: hypothetical protein JO184_10010 [Gammaproteobacteria bacterium]|nr:hypothetical protein [Gammaproteobacteria bacterium]